MKTCSYKNLHTSFYNSNIHDSQKLETTQMPHQQNVWHMHTMELYSTIKHEVLMQHGWTWKDNAATAKSLQLCPTLCDPIDGSPPGSPVPGILQARTLEWVAISFSNAWKWKVKVKLLSRVRLLVTPWTSAHQAPLSMGFSRQAYWSGVPLPSPKDNAKRSQTYILPFLGNVQNRQIQRDRN